MQLIVITPDSILKDEAEVINRLFECGLQRLHLRKPLATIAAYRKCLYPIDPEYHNRVVLCSHFELWDESEFGGIHLNSHMRNDNTILATIKNIPPNAVSTSYHSWQEIEDNEIEYGYVFASPVFDSISKSGYKAGIDLKGADELKQKLAKQNKYCPSIIGLGGVGVQQIKILHQYGFDGAAILGAIWTAIDPVEKFKEMLPVAGSLKGD